VALHVSQPAAVMAGAFADAGAHPDGLDLREIRRRIVGDLAGRADARVAVSADATAGAPADAIVGYAESMRPDLIVIGTRGATGLKQLVLGSVTEEVIRTAPCPVLAIPPRAGALPRFPFRRVLCATDYSAPSIAALRAAASLTESALAEVTVLHVIDDAAENDLFVARPYDVHRHADVCDEQARESLSEIVAGVFEDRRMPELRLAHGRPDQQILASAVEWDADLVVMGVQGRNGVNTMLFGSTTNSVIRPATCPVLTAHV